MTSFLLPNEQRLEMQDVAFSTSLLNFLEWIFPFLKSLLSILLPWIRSNWSYFAEPTFEQLQMQIFSPFSRANELIKDWTIGVELLLTCGT